MTPPAVVVAAIRDHPRPAVVAVDGPSAAGKTTFANTLRSAMPDAQVVHLDDFYRPMDEEQRGQLSAEKASQLLFDVDRLAEQVLAPLSAGRAAQYQIYSWSSNRLSDWAEVTPGGLVVLEGVHAADRRLRILVDKIVMVELRPQMRWERMLERGQNRPDQLQRWIAAEDLYLDGHRVREVADWTIAGEAVWPGTSS